MPNPFYNFTINKKVAIKNNINKDSNSYTTYKNISLSVIAKGKIESHRAVSLNTFYVLYASEKLSGISLTSAEDSVIKICIDGVFYIDVSETSEKIEKGSKLYPIFSENGKLIYKKSDLEPFAIALEDVKAGSTVQASIIKKLM
jgi:hypothetical protein